MTSANLGESIALWTSVNGTALVFALLVDSLILCRWRMSRGSGVLLNLGAWGVSMVVAGRTTAFLSLQVVNHLSLLTMGVHLGLSIGVDLLLSEVVGTATGYDNISLNSEVKSVGQFHTNAERAPAQPKVKQYGQSRIATNRGNGDRRRNVRTRRI